jgi:hypothetical protein
MKKKRSFIDILCIYDIISFYLENSAKTAYFKISHFGTAEKLFNYPVSLAILSQHQIALAFQEDVYNMIILFGSDQFKINALSFCPEIYRNN